jgi:YodL-like
MKILYRILLNEAKDPEGRHIGPCDGYKPNHPLVQSYSAIEGFPEISETDLCEFLYERFNIDHPAGYRNRSLCVGDVIVLERSHNDCVAYAVDRFGFKRVECPAGQTSLTAVL